MFSLHVTRTFKLCESLNEIQLYLLFGESSNLEDNPLIESATILNRFIQIILNATAATL